MHPPPPHRWASHRGRLSRALRSAGSRAEGRTARHRGWETPARTSHGGRGPRCLSIRGWSKRWGRPAHDGAQKLRNGTERRGPPAMGERTRELVAARKARPSQSAAGVVLADVEEAGATLAFAAPRARPEPTSALPVLRSRSLTAAAPPVLDPVRGLVRRWAATILATTSSVPCPLAAPRHRPDRRRLAQARPGWAPTRGDEGDPSPGPDRVLEEPSTPALIGMLLAPQGAGHPLPSRSTRLPPPRPPWGLATMGVCQQATRRATAWFHVKPRGRRREDGASCFT